MAWLKGQEVGGFVEISKKVNFTNSVIAQKLNDNPWAIPYFVDGVNGDDSFDGLSPSKAFATMQAAVTAASRGDVIKVRPLDYTQGTGFDRYSEQVTIPVGTNDLSIVGITNTLNAEFGVRHRWVTTGQPLNVLAPGVHVENIGYFAEGASYSVLLSNNEHSTKTQYGSNGATFYNCVFKGASFVTYAGTGTTLQRCRFTPAYGGTVASLTAIGSNSPVRQITARDCEFMDAIGGVASAPFITMTPPVTEILVRDCYFGQLPTGSVYIQTTGANYGLIANCFFNIADLDTDSEIALGDGVIAVACYDQAGLATTA